jgi:RNA polymerase sigma factor (sigma-70 family)
MLRTEDEYVCEILRMEKALRAILHRFAPQPADLEDLLQETYSHLFSLTADRRLNIRNVQAFAVTTARHIATDWVRHNKVVALEAAEDLSAMPVHEGGGNLDEIVHAHQQLVRIANSVAQLSDRDREAFTLRRVYGMTQKEIATKLRISEGAVEQLLNRGMRRCAELLETNEPEDRKRSPAREGWLGRWRKRLASKERRG